MSKISWRKRLVALGLALWLIIGLLGSALHTSSSHASPPPEGWQTPQLLGEAPRTPSLAPTPTGAAPQHGRGFVPPPVDLSHLDGRWRPGPQLAALSDERWDWREQGSVTAVRDQLNCGSCYAFATLASFESQLLIVGEGTYDLSEMQATHCHYEALHPYDTYDSGCDGGNIWMVTNLYSTQGASLEACDPYSATVPSCNTTCPLTKTVTDMWALGGPGVPLSSTLKNWLRNYGPLYVAMDAGKYDAVWAEEFSYYNGSYTLYHPMEPPYPNHAVLLVGWDDNLPHAGGTGGWIVKNSWGTGWGGTCGYGSEGGYFTIAYGSAGIGGWASLIAGWQDYDPDGSLLYLDEAGLQAAFGGSGTKQAWGLVRLTPGRYGSATQVEIWTNDVATVTLSIYDDFIYDDPDYGVATGLLWSSEDNTFDYAGYHSVPIQPPLPLTAGDDVNIMVKVQNATDDFPLALDWVGPPAGENQSFASPTGEDGSWDDYGSYEYDVGIRLRMVLSPTVTLYLPAVLKEWAPGEPSVAPTPP